MDMYKLAVDDMESADTLFNACKYRNSIYMYCMAVEKFLKSKIDYVEHPSELEVNHDVVGLIRCLNAKYPFNGDFRFITVVRKYFNESRYPYTPKEIDEVFTKDFAMEFQRYTADIKNYIDNDVNADLKDLEQYFANSDKKNS